MKSQSHRTSNKRPIEETHDDGVDEPWTVDCICGVNFDDGKKMVSCDVCGVWAHTRCSRYVESMKLFTCDKCKSKNSRNNEIEETEVAQVLVGLPNETMTKDNLYPSNRPSQRPVKHYTQISTEKTGHVHGVPGGDPSLFAGSSSVFSPELWKSTGHVPKKFNFQYKEFPSCDEKETEQVERITDEHDVKTKRFDSSSCCTNRDGKLKDDNTGDQREGNMKISHKVHKVSRSSRFSHVPVPKGRSSDRKSSALHSSSNVLPPSATAVPGFKKSTNSLKNAGASAHNQILSSGLPVKSEKINQADSQPSSKGNSSQNQPPVFSNPPSGLSDEELALLLHRQLNSSPRVPRMRHAGCLPHLTSPTATNMLMERTSTSEGKDFSFSGRRKSKDSKKGAAVSTRNVSDEAKKVERVSPSPDHRRKDSEILTSPLTHGEGESGLPQNVVRINKPPASTATTSSGSSSSTEVNEYTVALTRTSPRHTSDGDSGDVGHPLTLPGLISKIMSKGERMTLEELRDSVSPHWPHLRKRNGEPYADRSHSLAILHYLRQNPEWACLVDGCPKKSTRKETTKPDADLSDDESEDNIRRETTAQDGRSKILVCQRDEFPRGKRRAVRRRRRAQVVSDDEEDGSLSKSSGDKQDEMQGDPTSGTNEASATSDETTN